jgi:predicted nucleic acid-binding OB-fold protein
MSALTTHTFGNQKKENRKETNKKKLQQAIESRERQRTRSLEEDKSRTPLTRATARHIRDKTMLKQRAQTTKAYKSSPCTNAYCP